MKIRFYNKPVDNPHNQVNIRKLADEITSKPSPSLALAYLLARQKLAKMDEWQINLGLSQLRQRGRVEALTEQYWNTVKGVLETLTMLSLLSLTER